MFHVRCDCGTHMDSPAHRGGGRSISELEADELIAPLVLLRVESKVKDNDSYSVGMDDLQSFEKVYGEVSFALK